MQAFLNWIYNIVVCITLSQTAWWDGDVCRRIGDYEGPYPHSSRFPLHTRGTEIVDKYGQEVQIRAVNWPGHLDYMIPEGLAHQSVDYIAGMIKKMGFNAVRLTFAVQMIDEHLEWQDPEPQKLKNRIKPATYNDIVWNNPWTADAVPLDVFDYVVDSLARHEIMVIFDNHLSKAGWCCAYNDGNGYFGDEYFDTDKWMRALEFMATRYESNPCFVAVSLRNELRNSLDIEKWYLYMSAAAQRVHETNRNVLIIVSGLEFDTNLSFLKDRPMDVLDNKLVHEMHWYLWSYGDWSVPFACKIIKNYFMENAGFLMRKNETYSRPLIVSEFGINLPTYGLYMPEVNYIRCVTDWMHRNQLGFAWWGLQGDYYTRQGIDNFEETYGMLDKTWTSVKNPTFMQEYEFLFRNGPKPKYRKSRYSMRVQKMLGR